MNGLSLVELELFMTVFIVTVCNFSNDVANTDTAIADMMMVLTNMKKCRLCVKPSQKMLWMTS